MKKMDNITNDNLSVHGKLEIGYDGQLIKM